MSRIKSSHRRIVPLFLVTALLALGALTTAANDETGKVKWGRSVDAAITESKITGKPVFLLFQEVPG